MTFFLSALLAWSFFGSKTPVAPVASAVDEKAVQTAAEKAVQSLTEKAVKAAAEQAAKDLAAKKEAEAKAEKLREEARADAEKLRLEARADAEKLRLEARADAEKARSEAKTDKDEGLKRIETRIFRLSHASAEEVATSFNTMWNGDFGQNWKVSRMAVAFPESNAIMVTAPRIILDACEQSIAKLDVEPRQVYIEARFVELANNASHKLGIDWSMLDGMKGSLSLDAGYNERKMEGVSTYSSKDDTYTLSSSDAKTGPQNANLSHINATIGMSELYIVLRALEASEDARTFSNPKIIVSSGKKAIVDMTEKYPNVTISAKRTTSGTSDSMDLSMNMAAIPGEDKFMFAKEAFFSWGIELEVTPRIGTNGLINVSIVPTISSRTDWVTAGANDTSTADSNVGSYSSRYPVIDVQRLITEFSMASGTTAVIGGLSRTVERQIDSGIPWLRDIWWIGPRLFGSKQRIKEQKEIIVFVTVGLVDPKNIAQDAGLPKNAVLGRQYTEDIRREPGDRETRAEGMQSLDLRLLEDQYRDPRRTNRVQRVRMPELSNLVPFTKDPNNKKD